MSRSILAAAAAIALMSTGASAAGLQWGERGFPGTPAPSATTWRHTCGQIHQIIGANNHAYLTYSDRGYDSRNLVTALVTLGNHTSDRVVKDQRYCLLGENAQPIWVPTRDNAQCFAGYTCESGNSSGWRR